MNIVVLTGAGVSAESGIQTFRAADGLWEEHRVEDVASPEAYQRNPELVQTFYNERRRQLLSDTVKANAAHIALSKFEAAWADDFLLVTQNIDDLHERAGSRALLHMHGELLKKRCTRCAKVSCVSGDLSEDDSCNACHSVSTLRPDIVWFGEMPKYMDAIYKALDNCDLFLAIGTSGNVYPAAGFVQMASLAGAHCVELNLEPSALNNQFSEAVIGPAGTTVPNFLERLLAKQLLK